MIASQGGAIWLWIVTRPFGWWPTLRLTLGPRVRMYIAAGSAAFAPSRGRRTNAMAGGGVTRNRDPSVPKGSALCLVSSLHSPLELTLSAALDASWFSREGGIAC